MKCQDRPFERAARKIEDEVRAAAPRLEQDVKRAIAYVNDEVVPEVRRSSSKAIRMANEKLSQLAERLERRSAPQRPGA